jgi:predicted Zn-dependent protease
LARIGFTGQLESGLHAPFLRPRLLQTKLVTDIDQALARLAAMRAERFSRSGPSAEYAREAWSRSYASVGETALGTRAAVRAMRSAALLTPERAAAWTNLGVALERTGDASAAIACLHRAIELEPARSTAWVNLVRLELERRDSASARRALAAALAAGIRDPRLDQLADAVIH